MNDFNNAAPLFNDLGVRRELLVWRDRWFFKVHFEYAQLRQTVMPKLDLVLDALHDDFICWKTNELFENLIFPILDSFEGATRRSILINAQIELNDIYEAATSHNRERTCLPAIIYAPAINPWKSHPAYSSLKPTTWQRINTYGYAKTCRALVKNVAHDAVFSCNEPSTRSCKSIIINAIDFAARQALVDA